MRWDGRWTLGLFACAALLYWVNQLMTRPPSTLLQPKGDADGDDTAPGTSHGLSLSGGQFQVSFLPSSKHSSNKQADFTDLTLRSFAITQSQ